jgi:hypothetical protein
VRCSGHRPACQRCLRLRRSCVYEALGRGEIVRDVSGSVQVPTSAARSGRPTTPPATPSILGSENYLVDIPSSLVSSLVDVYFSHVYNASLLLHRQTFERELSSGTAKSHVILSVCAFASMLVSKPPFSSKFLMAGFSFYRNVNSGGVLDDSGFTYHWAERAGKLVFQELEEPHDDNIVTFINLALFWYSQGSWRRSFMLKGSQVVGLRRPMADYP